MAKRKRKRTPAKRRSKKRSVAHLRKYRFKKGGASKRRRARRANPSPVRRRRRRAHAAAPRRRRRANPSRRMSFRRKHHHKRRRNPSSPYVGAVIAAALAGVSFAVIPTVAFAVTQQLDPGLTTLSRNRKILSVVAGIAGIALAKKHPLYGIALAGGAAAAGFGGDLGMMLQGVVAKRPTQPISAVYGQSMSAVYGQSLGNYQRVAGFVPQNLSAVYGQSMGSFTPAAPWESRNPF